MILTMVLAAIIIAFTIATRMAEVGQETQRLMDYTQFRENNYLMARSAVEMGMELLRQDTGDTDSLQDFWAAGEMTLEWEGRPVTVSIVDEESKFPLSAMQRNPDDCDYLTKALSRFMVNAGVTSGPQAVDQFLDWVDSDSIRRSQGAEQADYTDNRRFKDGPCDSLYEVLALPAWTELPRYRSRRRTTTASEVGLNVSGDVSGVSGVSGEAESGPAPQSEISGEFAHSGTGESRFSSDSFKLTIPGGDGGTGTNEYSPWSDWMSVCSSGKVNINTAPREILRCLDEDLTDTLVAEIDNRRQSSAFEKEDLSELREVTGFNEDLRSRLKNFICVKSKVFEIQAVVHSRPGTVALKAYVDRSDGSLRVIRWEVK